MNGGIVLEMLIRAALTRSGSYRDTDPTFRETAVIQTCLLLLGLARGG